MGRGHPYPTLRERLRRTGTPTLREGLRPTENDFAQGEWALGIGEDKGE
jgi:hypothetical protein